MKSQTTYEAPLAEAVTLTVRGLMMTSTFDSKNSMEYLKYDDEIVLDY